MSKPEIAAGLKQTELQNCIICGKGMMHNGDLTFYRVSAQQFIVDVNAVQRQTGLEMMMGAAAPLAQIMGPNEHIALALSPPDTALMCQSCALLGNTTIGNLLSRFEAEVESDEQSNG